MTALEARTLATNLMRALLAVPGSPRFINLDGEESIVFVESLGCTRGRAIFEIGGAVKVQESAQLTAALGFDLCASIFLSPTEEEIALVRAKPPQSSGNRCVLVTRQKGGEDLTIGADLA